jgi:hypothetical protein
LTCFASIRSDFAGAGRLVADTLDAVHLVKPAVRCSCGCT